MVVPENVTPRSAGLSGQLKAGGDLMKFRINQALLLLQG